MHKIRPKPAKKHKHAAIIRIPGRPAKPSPKLSGKRRRVSPEIGEIVRNLGEDEVEERQVFTDKIGSLMPTAQDMKDSFFPILRGTAIGAFLGVLPGTGPAIAAFSSSTSATING